MMWGYAAPAVVGILYTVYRIVHHKLQTRKLLKTMRTYGWPMTVEMLEQHAQLHKPAPGRVLRFRDWGMTTGQLKRIDIPRPGGGVDIYYQLTSSPQPDDSS